MSLILIWASDLGSRQEESANLSCVSGDSIPTPAFGRPLPKPLHYPELCLQTSVCMKKIKDARLKDKIPVPTSRKF